MEQQKNDQNPSFNENKLFHGDFYRIDDPTTLTLKGISDTMENYDYCFIEWPNFPEYYADS
jgi:tRNA A37 threonylcarbamoyladenosine biosynthesis protein TsaE